LGWNVDVYQLSWCSALLWAFDCAPLAWIAVGSLFVKFLIASVS
jgi:hypothetical protein